MLELIIDNFAGGGGASTGIEMALGRSPDIAWPKERRWSMSCPALDEPLHTATTKDRFGLVTVMIAGEPHVIADIGMRMLTPRELFRAQGFADSYIIDRKPDGSPISKTAQVGKCGNSVCPPMAAALVKANFVPCDVEMPDAEPFFLEAAE